MRWAALLGTLGVAAGFTLGVVVDNVGDVDRAQWGTAHVWEDGSVSVTYPDGTEWSVCPDVAYNAEYCTYTGPVVN